MLQYTAAQNDLLDIAPGHRAKLEQRVFDLQQAERDRLAGAGVDGDGAAAADGFSFAVGFAGFGDGEAGAEGDVGGEAGGGGGSPAQAVGGGGSPARVVVAGYGGGSPDVRDFLLGSSSDEED
eukprot:SAG22_NODE_184_length_15968_cov_39.081858_10_plen_123_part_00